MQIAEMRPWTVESRSTIRPIGRPANRSLEPDVFVYDFFSGCGGTSAGLKRAGMTPMLAVDFDGEAIETYRKNFPNTTALRKDIRDVATGDIEHLFDRPRATPILFSACAPCQPFSRQNRQKKPDDLRTTLLSELHRFIERFRPELLLIENVPELRRKRDRAVNPFEDITRLLERLGYSFDSGVLRAPEYGVPQSRHRLFLVASLFGPLQLPLPTHGSPGKPFRTVREAISQYPPITAGETNSCIPNHRASALSAANLARIRATGPGADRRSWPVELVLNCHDAFKGFTDVYGRMHWDRPAPALTTRCISLSNGRFGHPDQDRAISIREAAALQTFDDDFVFTGSINSMARQIGNAVPVELAYVVGRMIIEHVSLHVNVMSHG